MGCGWEQPLATYFKRRVGSSLLLSLAPPQWTIPATSILCSCPIWGMGCSRKGVPEWGTPNPTEKLKRGRKKQTARVTESFHSVHTTLTSPMSATASGTAVEWLLWHLTWSFPPRVESFPGLSWSLWLRSPWLLVAVGQDTGPQHLSQFYANYSLE